MPAIDTYPEGQGDSLASYRHGAAVTPHDTNELTYATKALFVGGTGTLTVVMLGGETVLFTSPLAGQIIHVRCKIVKTTGTTATNIVALW